MRKAVSKKLEALLPQLIWMTSEYFEYKYADFSPYDTVLPFWESLEKQWMAAIS